MFYLTNVETSDSMRSIAKWHCCHKQLPKNMHFLTVHANLIFVCRGSGALFSTALFSLFIHPTAGGGSTFFRLFPKVEYKRFIRPEVSQSLE